MASDYDLLASAIMDTSGMKKELEQLNAYWGEPICCYTVGEEGYEEIHGVWRASGGSQVISAKKLKSGLFDLKSPVVYSMQQILALSKSLGV